MKDIDFDELDRAVGSVLGTAGDNAPKSDAPVAVTAVASPDPVDASPASTPSADVTPVDTPPADSSSDDSSPADTPFAATPVVAPAPVTPDVETPSDAPDIAETPEVPSDVDTSSDTPEVKPSVSPARKRGQFLDMVHPSADMRKAPATAPIPRKKISPLTSTVSEEKPESTEQADSNELGEPTVPFVASSFAAPAPVTPDVSAPAETQEANAEPVEPTPQIADTPDETSQTPAWPDPLNFGTGATNTPETPSEVTSSAAPSVGTDFAAVEASQTPFVTDAKVDKRPLGAFATQEDEDATLDVPAAPVIADETSDVSGDSPEFNSEVNSVESTGVPQAEDEATGLTGETTDAVLPEAEEPLSATAAAAAPAPEVAPAEVSESPAPAIDAVPAPVTAGVAQSIPQQYKTPGSEKDDVSHPLFDTEEYHQPLLPDGKKKSKTGLLIIVLLIILLIVGGVLGYFAYTMGV